MARSQLEMVSDGAWAWEMILIQSLAERENLVSPEDPVALMYTSGTTGVSKGVMLDHLGLINKSLASAKRQGLTGEDRLCLFFPLYHMFGNTCIALTGLLTGASLVMPCLAFDPSKVLKAIGKRKPPRSMVRPA
jgi:acyl-CoA synthetase (AMP-forming)/AMP-acid ligase II